MNQIYLLLGSNKEDRFKYLLKAKQCIQKTIGAITNFSGIYETAAWGNQNQAAFLNQLIIVQSLQNPFQTLLSTQKIEKKLGRKRLQNQKWSSRTIDIDILFFNKEIIKTENLIIPHPYLHLRRFCLVPLVEITPYQNHPILNKNMQTLLTECFDNLKVYKYNQPNS